MVVILKVLVIDDEPIVREGIKTIIPWEEYGFQVCGEATDGREGIERIFELKPDLVIVDIKMPEMNGLEMIEELDKQGINIKTIVLTGYSSFEYAQQAVKFGVEAYILKPIEEEELIDCVKKAAKEILKERENREAFNTSVAFSQDKAIESLVTESMSKDKVEKLNKVYGLGFPWMAYQVVLFEVEHSGSCPISKEDAVEIVRRYVTGNGLGHVFRVNERIGVLCGSEVEASGCNWVYEVNRSIEDSCGSKVVAAVGCPVQDYKDINLSYSNALDLLSKKFIFESCRVFTNEPVHKPGDFNPCFQIDDVTNKLFYAAEVRDISEISKVLDGINDWLVFKGMGEEDIKAYYGSIYITVASKFAEAYKNIGSMPQNQDLVLRQIQEQKSLKGLKGFISEKMVELSKGFLDMGSEHVVDMVVQYIKNNFHRNLRLEDISRIFGYSTGHMGKLFKKQTGKNFNQYLDIIRIGAAKEMLAQGMKVYEVAEKTGYCNTDYFYSKFKKLVGLSPTEFKSTEGII